MVDLADITQAVLTILLIVVNIINLVLAGLALRDAKNGYDFVRDYAYLFYYILSGYTYPYNVK